MPAVGQRRRRPNTTTTMTFVKWREKDLHRLFEVLHAQGKSFFSIYYY